MHTIRQNDDAAVLDAALERLAEYGPDLKNGMTDHTPMVLETLCAWNRLEAVDSWIEKQMPQLMRRAAPKETMQGDNWRLALGNPERSRDWFEFFRVKLENARSVGPILDEWVAKLAPGISAAAVHGVIRTGHAVRAISRGTTPARRRELADGLALWAAGYLELPTAPLSSEPPTSTATATTKPLEALRRVSLVPQAQRSFDGTIVGSLRVLHEHPDFAPVIRWIELSDDLAGELDRIIECFARVFLTNARDALTAIVFIHGVTGCAALRPILPHVCQKTGAAAVRYAWQAGCGLFAAFGFSHCTAADGLPPIEIAARESWIDRAIASDDDHLIKFTGTCLEEFDRSGLRVFLQAIRLAHQILRGATPDQNQ